jgi:hypothetical protein
MPIYMTHRSKEYLEQRKAQVDEMKKRTKLPLAELTKRKAELIKKLQAN